MTTIDAADHRSQLIDAALRITGGRGKVECEILADKVIAEMREVTSGEAAMVAIAKVMGLALAAGLHIAGSKPLLRLKRGR